MVTKFIPRTGEKHMFKPGQLFTIDNHVYRITKNTPEVYTCCVCAFEDRPGFLEPCAMCLYSSVFPPNCHFKLVK